MKTIVFHKQVTKELEQVGLGYDMPCSYPLCPLT